MTRWLRLFAAFMVVTLTSTAALAHKPSDSYLTLKAENDRITGHWDIALRDLDFAIGLDGDGNGEITWGEVRARHSAIAAYALARLSLATEGDKCVTTVTDHLVDRHSDGAYAVLQLAATCPQNIAALEINYQLFSDLDPQHKGLLQLEQTAGPITAIFSPERAQQKFDLQRPDALGQFVDYLRHGVWHIWIGFDHILFLLSLLLPAVAYFSAGRWQALTGFRPAFWDVLRIVTGFTVAHSITLSLAALGILQVPSRLVESSIALSVVLAAANNVYPLVLGRRWLVAFGFGLIHGFGFASVLADLGLPRDALVLALVGFNLGVEAGQLAIVAVFLPIAYALRHTVFYRRIVLTGGSIAIILVAGIWFIERAFDLTLISS